MLNYYKFGGSLRYNHPSYVIRKADDDLYHYLKIGEYCFVLNSRQMGKSSLRVRVTHQLRNEGVSCAFIDLTTIGNFVTQQQWYCSFASELINSLELDDQINLNSFWETYTNLTDIQILKQLLEFILTILSGKLVIFIDEIDSLLKIPFKDDFFAFIRACYQQRVNNTEYEKLTFCLLGVASPDDLIKDKEKTPFNVGRSINLAGITFEEAKKPLSGGLSHFSNSETLLKQILDWTGGQPFLTQKVCHLVTQYDQDSYPNLTKIIQNHIILNWESQDDPIHLKTIRDRLLVNETKAIRLLTLYSKILQKPILADETEAQITLRLTGIAVKQKGYLQVYNPIYQQIFNPTWIQEQINQLRPYSIELNQWLNHQQNPNYLLKGNHLATAIDWSKDKSLSDLDYQFLSASQAEQDRQTNQILAEANRKAKQLIWRGGWILGITSMLSILIAIATTIYTQKQLHQIKQVNHLEQASLQALERFPQQQLDSLRIAIQAGQDLKKIVSDQQSLATYPTLKPLSSLIKILNDIKEKNQLLGHSHEVKSVDFSPNDQQIITGSKDGTVKQWSREGHLLKTLYLSDHNSPVNQVNFSPKGQFMMAVNMKGILKVWTVEGVEITHVKQNDPIYTFAITPDEKVIITAGSNGLIKLWTIRGKLLKTIYHNNSIYSLIFNPNNQQIITADNQGFITFFSMKGKKLKQIKAHSDIINSLDMSSDGKRLVSGSGDKTAKLWTIEGKLLTTLSGHQQSIHKVIFSQNNQKIISGSLDKTIKIWSTEGQLQETLKGHQSEIYNLSLSSDGNLLASASKDKTVKLWQLNKSENYSSIKQNDEIIYAQFNRQSNKIIVGDTSGIINNWFFQENKLKPWLKLSNTISEMDINLDKNIIILGQVDGQIQRVKMNRELLSFIRHKTEIITQIKISPNGEEILSGNDSGVINLWSPEGRLIRSIKAYPDEVSFLGWYLNNKEFISVNQEGLIKFWNNDGTLTKTIQDSRLKEIKTISFNPQSHVLAVAHSSGFITFWNSNGFLYQLNFNTLDEIKIIQFSSDGKMIGIGYGNGKIELWTANQNSQLLLSLEKGNHPVNYLRFDSKDKKLIAGYSNGLVYVWNFELDDNLKQGCQWLKDYQVTRIQQKYPQEVNSIDGKVWFSCNQIDFHSR